MPAVQQVMSVDSFLDVDEKLDALARQIFQSRQHKLYARIDKLLGALMLVQWLVAVVLAVCLTPRTWIGTQSAVHIHVIAILVLGSLITAFPVFLALNFPGRTITRNCIGAGQLLMSALLIHLSGGRIEAHFHVFCSLAFLALYRDWRVLILPTVIVALDHALRGFFFPLSVYGVNIVQPWRWLEHTGWVMFEDAVLIISSRYSMFEMKEYARSQAQVELTKSAFEKAVIERTADLQVARDQALEATQLKSQFLANMSHELRTPLSGVIGVTELLIDTSLDDEQKELVDMLQVSSHSLLSVINDLLDLAKIEARKMTLEMVPCQISDILQEIGSLISTRANEKELFVDVVVSDKLPKWIKSDPLRLRQILLNLAANAVKFTDAGSVRLSAEPFEDSGNLMVRFSVEDTGIGIPEAKRDQIFEPFFQADGSNARSYGGTGLGLSICKRLVELMGGKIGFDSVQGEGSVFWFSLPGEAVSPEELQAYRQDEGGKSARLAGDTSKKILVVEDSPVLYRVISLQLREAGYQVEWAGDGQIALDMLAQKRFDLVLMDCQMPVLDGYETTRRIREREQSGQARIPVIAITASAMAADRENCLAAGMDDYISKPVRKNLMLATLKRWLLEPGSAQNMRIDPITAEEKT